VLRLAQVGRRGRSPPSLEATDMRQNHGAVLKRVGWRELWPATAT